jgi:hypothetical protein
VNAACGTASKRPWEIFLSRCTSSPNDVVFHTDEGKLASHPENCTKYTHQSANPEHSLGRSQAEPQDFERPEQPQRDHGSDRGRVVPGPQAAIGRSVLLQRRAVRDGAGEERLDQIPVCNRAQRFEHALRFRRRQHNHDPEWPVGFALGVCSYEPAAQALGHGRRAGGQDGRRGQDDALRRLAVPQVGARAPGPARHRVRRGHRGQPQLRGRFGSLRCHSSLYRFHYRTQAVK